MARVRVQVPVEKPAVQDQPVVQQQLQTGPPLTKNNLIIGLAILAVAIGFILLMNDRNRLKQEVNKQSTNQVSAGQTDALKYQEEIGKIVELPTGQTPSLVSVTDSKKLAGENPFFKNAQDGDVVLLYVSPDKSVRAILYRPSSHKVIEATSSATIGTGTSAKP